jgi:hypothetical protein
MAKTPREMIMESFMGELKPRLGELEEQEAAEQEIDEQGDEDENGVNKKESDQNILVDSLRETDIQGIHYLKHDLSKDFMFQRDITKPCKLAIMLYKINEDAYKPFLEILLKKQDGILDLPTIDLKMDAFSNIKPPEESVPVEEPTSVPVEEPTSVPVEEPTSEPVEEPTSEPVEEPTSEPVEEPTSVPVEDTSLAPLEEPTSEQEQAQEPSPSSSLEQAQAQEPSSSLEQVQAQEPSLSPSLSPSLEQVQAQEPSSSLEQVQEQAPVQEPVQVQAQALEPSLEPTIGAVEVQSSESVPKQPILNETQPKMIGGNEIDMIDSDDKNNIQDDPFFDQCAQFYETITSHFQDVAKDRYKGFVKIGEDMVVAVFDYSEDIDDDVDISVPVKTMQTAIIDEIINKKKVFDMTIGETVASAFAQNPIITYILDDETKQGIDIPIAVHLCKEAPNNEYDNVFYQSEEEKTKEQAMINEPIFHEYFGSTNLFSVEPLDQTNASLIKRYATFTQNTVYLTNKEIPLQEYNHLKEKLSVCFWENDKRFISVKTTDLFVEL